MLIQIHLTSSTLYRLRFCSIITTYNLQSTNILPVKPHFTMRGRGDQMVDQNGLNDAKIYVKLCASSQEKLIIVGRATDL